MEKELIKVLSCRLLISLLRNINDNFESISFDLKENGDIQVKVILSQIGDCEKELIEDIEAEFTATQEEDIVLPFLVTDNMFDSLFQNVVFKVK